MNGNHFNVNGGNPNSTANLPAAKPSPQLNPPKQQHHQQQQQQLPHLQHGFSSRNSDQKTVFQSNNPRPFKAIPYTEEEHERIQTRLNRVLGPEYVSSRPGGGGSSVSYIEGWRALNLANEIFGFNGWSTELITSQVDYVDVHRPTNKVSLGLSVVVRITIRDGTYHEDFGYGFIENARSKAAAFEKCKKEAFTDGIKRCLRCFGNVMGNCLYDKATLSKIQKVKLTHPDLTDDDFHRDPLIVKRDSMKQNTTHVNINSNSVNLNKQSNGQTTKEVNQDPKPINNQQVNRSIVDPSSNKSTIQKSNQQINGNQASNEGNTGAQVTNQQINEILTRQPKSTHTPTPQPQPQQPHQLPKNPPQQTPNHALIDLADFDDSFIFSDDIAPDDDMDDDDVRDLNNITENRKHRHNNNSLAPSNTEIPQNVSFFNAKQADLINQTPEEISKLPAFNAKFISPNIRRTIDPSKSVPIKRSEIIQSQSTKVTKPLNNGATNNVNNNKRMIGLPPSQRSQNKRIHKEYVII